MSHLKNIRFYLLCFFLSGFAGLVYQIIWVRKLSLIFGNTVYAVSMVVAAFLTGLAIGSYYWGKRADNEKSPIKLYMYMELGIGLSAVTMTLMMHFADDFIVGFMSPESVAVWNWQLLRYLLMFALLLLPTALMGGTLPVMARHLTRGVKDTGYNISSLYAFNTYGAMAGAFLSGLVFIPFLGLFWTLFLALALNVSIFLLVATFVPVNDVLEIKNEQADEPKADKKKSNDKKKKKKKKQKNKKAINSPEERLASYLFPVFTAIVLMLLSGFTTMAFEVLWTRAFVISFKSTVYLFSNLLTVLLLGMAVGSHVIRKQLDRLIDPMRIFGFAQIGIAIFGFGSILFFMESVDLSLWMIAPLGKMSWTKDLFVMFCLMLILISLPAFLMGLSYPIVCRVVNRSLESVGKDAGNVYAVGTLGGILGSLVTGFLLLPTLGLQKSIYCISGLALLTGYTALLKSSSPKKSAVVFPVSAFTALAMMVAFSIMGTNIGLGRTAGGKVLFSNEDMMGTVKVIQGGKGGPLTLMVNDYQLATSGDVAVRFGHMPMLLKPSAKDILVISLGSGITSGAIGGHPVRSIEGVELVPSLLDVQPYFKHDNHNIVADKRFKLFFWDGRHYVKMTKKKYDLVVSDLFQPDSAGVGTLWTLEHFLNVKKVLKDGGAMAQWLPMYQLSPENLKVIMKTFASAFEYVSVWNGDINSAFPTLMLVGSSKPIKIHPKKLADALEREAVKRDMIEYADPMSLLAFYVTDREGVMEFAGDAPINTEDLPVIEYSAPKNIWKRRQNGVKNFSDMIALRKPITPNVAGATGDKQFSSALKRYYDGRKLLMTAKVEHEKQNYPEELKKLEETAKFVPTDPNLALAVFDLGYFYYSRRDYRSSSKLFEWSRKVNPSLLEAHFYLAKSYKFLGKLDKSKQALVDLVKLRPELADQLLIKRDN